MVDSGVVFLEGLLRLQFARRRLGAACMCLGEFALLGFGLVSRGFRGGRRRIRVGWPRS